MVLCLFLFFRLIVSHARNTQQTSSVDQQLYQQQQQQLQHLISRVFIKKKKKKMCVCVCTHNKCARSLFLWRTPTHTQHVCNFVGEHYTRTPGLINDTASPPPFIDVQVATWYRVCFPRH